MNSLIGSAKVNSMTGFPNLGASSEIREDPNEDNTETMNALDGLLMGGLETSVVIKEEQ